MCDGKPWGYFKQGSDTVLGIFLKDHYASSLEKHCWEKCGPREPRYDGLAVVQVRGDKGLDFSLLLGCSVKGEMWL